jgi:hypothetical protein
MKLTNQNCDATIALISDTLRAADKPEGADAIVPLPVSLIAATNRVVGRGPLMVDIDGATLTMEQKVYVAGVLRHVAKLCLQRAAKLQMDAGTWCKN